MTQRTLLPEDLQGRSAEDLLLEVARDREVVTVILADGVKVEIRPGTVLEPLPRLEGRVPEGWKDAILAP